MVDQRPLNLASVSINVHLLQKTNTSAAFHCNDKSRSEQRKRQRANVTEIFILF